MSLSKAGRNPGHRQDAVQQTGTGTLREISLATACWHQPRLSAPSAVPNTFTPQTIKGPRHDPGYPEESLDAFENLLLLCGRHHAAVDQHESCYAVEELEDWKARQVAQSGTRLSVPESRQVFEQTIASRDRHRYTQEKPKAISAEITHADGHGLDDCTARQRDLRAMLALYVFNSEPVVIGRWPRETRIRPEHMSTITCYDSVVSPRHDHLVLVSHAPDNVIQYLEKNGHSPIPGLRPGAVEPTARGYRCYDFVHMPTGALLTVTSDKLGPDQDRVALARSHADAIAGADAELTPAERDVLKALPTMTAGAKRLLAGLAVRTNLANPDGTWYLGAWFDQDRRRLIGEGDHWDLEWFGGYPSAHDLVACLTDRMIGIAGISARFLGPPGYQLRLGTAHLTVRAWATDHTRSTGSSTAFE
jgi:hypothetical protein